MRIPKWLRRRESTGPRHADSIMSRELQTEIQVFFITRGFTEVWLGLVSDGAEYVFSVDPAELAKYGDVDKLTVELMGLTQRKIWIVGYGDTPPSEIFFY